MGDMAVSEITNGDVSASRRSSRDSSVFGDWWQEVEGEQDKENALSRGQDGGDDSRGKLVLHDGGRLAEESRTELGGFLNPGFKGGFKNGEGGDRGTPKVPDIPPRHTYGGGTGTARHRAFKSGNIVFSIPEGEELPTIPNDGNLASFSADAMATFLRYLRLDDRLVNHLHRSGMDGRRFGRLKDGDLDTLKLNSNPVLVYFRDRTAPNVTSGKKAKPRINFIL